MNLRTLLMTTAVASLATQSVAQDDRFADCRESTIGEAAIGGPFELVDENGSTVTDVDILTEPTLLYFGYTFCPDVCPFDLSRNTEAVEILEEDGHIVQPVFISIDPARDTVEVVRDYTDLFHDRMIGLTGSEEQVRAASQAYRTYYRAQNTSDEYYLVDHSTFTYLVLPEIGFVEFFRSAATPEDIARLTACYLDQI